MILIAIAIPSVWKTHKTDGTVNESVQPVAALKTEESISSSQAVSAESASKPEGTSQIAESSDSKVALTEEREAIVIRAQSDENKLAAPPSAKQESASSGTSVSPNPAGNPPSGGNTIINDVFPPIAAPRGGAGGGGRGGGRGVGGAGTFGAVVQGGTLSGTVTDTTGAIIPGVTVSATNTESGDVKTVLTNASGIYTFVGLTPGPYRLNATLTGFQTAILVNINLGSAESQRVNIAMTIGDRELAKVVAVDNKNAISQSTASVGQVLPNNDAELLAYLTQLAQLRGAAGNATLTVDGFTNGNLPPQAQIAELGQGQGQRAAAGGGIGVGEGHGVGGGTAGAPPPPPPPGGPPPPPARIVPDNPTTLDGISIYDRRAAPNTASYAPIIDNPFRRVSQEPLSTFSSDVDTASYANLRRFINQNQLPPAAAVRIEEMVNYFNYDYAQPSGKDPIGAAMEIASAPWNPSHRLVRIGIKARDIDTRRRPPSNLVFLIDVSGSMQPPERLPLIKNGLKMLAGSLTENDHVSIVVYAGASGVVLPSTSGNRKDIINAALDRLEAGGSTNGGAGIQLAYQIAMNSFITGGTNRVILATDGDFNVGVTNQTQLTRLIQESAKSGVFLSVLGVGTDNLKDSTMERLADTGNGNYAYLDSLNEAYKVLVEQMSGTLVTVAKDVKLQVEFNPAVVEAYRLIGYENRLLANADFNNDRKDAGDMGAGHTVTALYEIVPKGGAIPGPDVDPLKYQTPAQAPAPAAQARNGSTETLTLKIRYKDPDGTESKLLSLPLTDREGTFSKASADFRFAASVAEFGMILRDSPYRGKASVGEVIENAQASKGSDRNGYRQEFIGLVQRARQLRGRE
jgi:Ca-activated chloride channel family protein